MRDPAHPYIFMYIIIQYIYIYIYRFCHYICCPILWQLAREALEIREVSVLIERRLCFIDPYLDTLKLLC